MLQALSLGKSYGDRTAVEGLSIEVRPGEIVGLLGPNGAGKSTTVGMLCGLVAPDRGEVLLGGERLNGRLSPLKRRIGLVPQDIALYDKLSARANLQLFGALYGVPRERLARQIDQALAHVGLSDRANDKPDTFSGGMKRRLNIACALVHNPDVLLFDEPTVGVDPQSRNAIFDNLEALRAAGKALVYTTHYMEEAERLADRIVIVDHGRVVAEGTVQALVSRLPTATTLEVAYDGAFDAGALDGLPGVQRLRQDAGHLTVAVADLTTATPAVLGLFTAQGCSVRHLNSGRANLEDVFLSLTGRQLRD